MKTCRICKKKFKPKNNQVYCKTCSKDEALVHRYKRVQQRKFRKAFREDEPEQPKKIHKFRLDNIKMRRRAK